uniref:SpoIIE family protein phosphatase n=1 Tax=Protofrankia symbiont of Coriaria ruscifolia TaxID=1306542 RepID=UPI001A9430C3
MSGEQFGDLPLEHVVTAGVDAHGTVTAWSTNACRLLGYPPAEIVGRAVFDLLAVPLPEPARRRLANRQDWSGTVALRHRDGHGLDVWLRAQPLLGSDEAVAQWFVTAVASPDLREYRADLALVDWAFTQAPIGLAIFDTEARFRRLNAEGVRMLGVGEDDIRGRPATEAFSHPAYREAWDKLRRAVETGEPARYEAFRRAQAESYRRAWAVTMSPVRDPVGQVRGVFLTSLDISEQYWAEQRLTLLNEANTAIGSTLDVERTAQELADIAVPRFADWASVDLLDAVYHGNEPAPGPITTPVALRRTAHQSALPGQSEAVVALGQTDTYPPHSPISKVLATGQAAYYRISDPEITRWVADSPARAARIREYGIRSIMIVPLRARGTTLGIALLARHRRPEPFTPADLLLAEELGAHTAICLDNARRYTRERATALTLQRSLLPQQLPQPAAVEIASRYLPAGAQAGVGGDWYDVIPLSGARVALVVGDVVDHGIRAAATMGQLRTAVRTLADADPTPEELLTRLDDVVTRLTTDQDTASGSQGADHLGATCLYAVYDPISRHCTLASAGHPPPALRT